MSRPQAPARRPELVCPAGTPAALRAAVEAGGDVVYLGFRDETNARNFPGLNFSREELFEGLAFAHDRGVKVYLAVNTYPEAGDPAAWRRAVDDGASLGVDALILADIGLIEYAARTHPEVRRHLSVQASAASAEAIALLHDAFGIARVVLPRVLTVAEIARINQAVAVETEVFAFGGMCPMAEGRCLLSSYVTGESPNRNGACSPAAHVRYEERGSELVSRLGAFTINRFGPGEPAGYPTLCKGRFVAHGRPGYLFEDPVSLSTFEVLPELIAAGVAGLKIEGRQRGRAYVAAVVKAYRAAIDACLRGEPPETAPLRRIAEGQSDTQGAYRRDWR
jgi:putative protease